MAHILKTIHLSPSPYYAGSPSYTLTITDCEILYAQESGANRWSLATVTLLEVDTPFTDDDINHFNMPTNVDEKDSYIKEVKYRHMKNERIAALEELLQKETTERIEVEKELELHKNVRYELYRVLESI